MGYAIFFETYSSFLALPTLFLEDLFVAPARSSTASAARSCAGSRGKPCGATAGASVAVSPPDQLALDFYDRLGARRMTDWHSHRLAGAALARWRRRRRHGRELHACRAAQLAL
ncbi:MAG: hypothetical protein U1E76_21850 [Planctomycetota bacterium]